jgi:hypothetical protein
VENTKKVAPHERSYTRLIVDVIRGTHTSEITTNPLKPLREVRVIENGGLETRVHHFSAHQRNVISHWRIGGCVLHSNNAQGIVNYRGDFANVGVAMNERNPYEST